MATIATIATKADSAPALDYRTAFELAPIGLVLSRHRLMVDCNEQSLAMFGAARADMVGHSFELLYPTHEEFERTGERIAARIAASLNASGWYADERVMKRVAGAHAASCSGAMCRAARSTQRSRTRPVSGRSKTCRRGAASAWR